MTLAHWNKLIIKKSQIKMAFLFSFPLFCGVHQTNSNEKSKHRPNELKNILLVAVFHYLFWFQPLHFAIRQTAQSCTKHPCFHHHKKSPHLKIWKMDITIKQNLVHHMSTKHEYWISCIFKEFQSVALIDQFNAK